MNFLYISSFTIWMFIIIINLNVSSVISKLVPIQNNDPSEWREYGANGKFLKIYYIYLISQLEECSKINENALFEISFKLFPYF